MNRSICSAKCSENCPRLVHMLCLMLCEIFWKLFPRSKFWPKIAEIKNWWISQSVRQMWWKFLRLVHMLCLIFSFFLGWGGGDKNWVKILTKNCRNWIFDESLNLFGKIYWKFPRLVHMLCLMLCECFTIFWKKIAQIIDQKLQKLIFWWISQSIQPNRVKISHISPHGMLDDLWNFQILPFLVPADMALPRVYNKTIFNIGNKASIT